MDLRGGIEGHTIKMVHCQNIPIIIIIRPSLEIIFKIIEAIEAVILTIEMAPSSTRTITVMVIGSRVMVITSLTTVGVEEDTGLGAFITQGMIDIIYRATRDDF